MLLEARVPFPARDRQCVVPVVLPPDLTNLPDGCFIHPFGWPVCPPPEAQQKLKLGLWYGTRFANFPCADLKLEQFLGGPIFGSVQTLATHGVVPLLSSTFSGGDSTACY